MAKASLIMLAVALMTSVGAGVVLHAADTESPEHLVTVEGKVVAVEWNPHFNVSSELTLRDANGTNYSVELAPPWWLAQQHLPGIHVNDTLKVQGVLDDEHEIEAFTIWINGGSAITIRTGEMPPWAQERSGEADDNETEDEGSD